MQQQQQQQQWVSDTHKRQHKRQELKKKLYSSSNSSSSNCSNSLIDGIDRERRKSPFYLSLAIEIQRHLSESKSRSKLPIARLDLDDAAAAVSTTQLCIVWMWCLLYSSVVVTHIRTLWWRRRWVMHNFFFRIDRPIEGKEIFPSSATPRSSFCG